MYFSRFARKIFCAFKFKFIKMPLLKMRVSERDREKEKEPVGSNESKKKSSII
jgi:hypothetical protein